MALQQRERFYEFLARITRVSGADRMTGMHAQTITEVYDDVTQAVLFATVGPATAVDWDGLVALMHEDDRALLLAALEAAL